MEPNKLYKELARLVCARLNCIESGNTEWEGRHKGRIIALVDSLMPSGSGVDSGTKIDLERSHKDRLFFTASYHHMNESGMYDGWTDHVISVRPSLCFGFTLAIGGQDRNGIKEYLHERYSLALSQAAPAQVPV